MLSSIKRLFRRERFDPMQQISSTVTEVYKNVIFGVMGVALVVILFFQYNIYGFAARMLPNYLLIIRIVMALIVSFTGYKLYTTYSALQDPGKLLTDTAKNVAESASNIV